MRKQIAFVVSGNEADIVFHNKDVDNEEDKLKYFHLGCST